MTAPPYADRRFTPAMAQDAFEEGSHPRGEGGKFSSVSEVRSAMKLKPKSHYLGSESGMKAFHVHLGSNPDPIGEIHQHRHQTSKKLFGHVSSFGKPTIKWTGEHHHSQNRGSVGFGLSRNDVLDRIASRHYLANK